MNVNASASARVNVHDHGSGAETIDAEHVLDRGEHCASRRSVSSAVVTAHEVLVLRGGLRIV